MKSEKAGRRVSLNTKRGVTPNDLKLSDRGGLAAAVPVGSAGLPHSGCQTGAVRCSAWFGVTVWVESCANWKPKGSPGKEKLPPVAVTRAQKRRATPGELRWGMKPLTKALRAAKRCDAPGTDCRSVKLGPKRITP